MQYGVGISINAGAREAVWKVSTYKYKIYLECMGERQIGMLEHMN